MLISNLETASFTAGGFDALITHPERESIVLFRCVRLYRQQSPGQDLASCLQVLTYTNYDAAGTIPCSGAVVYLVLLSRHHAAGEALQKPSFGYVLVNLRFDLGVSRTRLRCIAFGSCSRSRFDKDLRLRLFMFDYMYDINGAARMGTGLCILMLCLPRSRLFPPRTALSHVCSW